jgi:mannose-6-phosphate isomerase-like protein (cupin superfamily)
MGHTHISLDREADARFSGVFDAAVAAERATPDDGRSFDQLRADAFMHLVTATPVPGSRRPVELLVICDLETLKDGLHETGVCETFDGPPVPPATVRRLACDANIFPHRARGRRPRGRRRTGQTPGHRRPTTSTPHHARNVRGAGLPRPVRGPRHPPPQGMATGRRDRPGQLDATVQQPPPPHPPRPPAPTGEGARRLTARPRPAAGAQARPVIHEPTPTPTCKSSDSYKTGRSRPITLRDMEIDTVEGFDLARTFARLTDDGGIQAATVTTSFWRGKGAAASGDRFVGIVDFSSPEDLHTSGQEVHPDGDELVVVLAGALDVMIDDGPNESTIALDAGRAAVIPRRTWHRLVMREPGRLLFINIRTSMQSRALRTGADAG